jgi:regulator of sigma E protease
MSLDPLYIVLAIFILGFLIAIHEAGHMIVAKWMGMRVLRYSIGFGPVLWKRTWGETTYQLAAIPFGGFVEIDGMSPMEEHEDPDDPRLYENKSVWARALVIFAGPLTNYLFAFIFAAILYGALGTANWASKSKDPYDLTIEMVSNDKPADKAGLKPGDIVTHVDGLPVTHLADYYEIIKRQKKGYRYEPNKRKRKALLKFPVKIRRAGQTLVVEHPLPEKGEALPGVTLTNAPKGSGAKVTRVSQAAKARGGLRPGDVVIAVEGHVIKNATDLHNHALVAQEGFRWAGKDRHIVNFWIKRGSDGFKRDVRPDAETGLIGVRFKDPIKWKRTTFWNDVWTGFQRPVDISMEMLKGLGKLIQLDKKVASSAAGPVGIVVEVQRRLDAGSTGEAMIIVILLSVLLGLFNLLPVPALDGGRLVFRLIEIVTRWRISPRAEMRVHWVGFVVLISLMLILTVKDVRACF